VSYASYECILTERKLENRTHVLSEWVLQVLEVPCNGGVVVDLGPIVFAKIKVARSTRNCK
jgi:hypothetical protein